MEIFLSLLKKGQWADAAQHLDARFLAALGLGIACGIVLLANAMHFLLDVYLPETFAVFLGLLAASLWVVVKSIDQWNLNRVLTLLVAAGFAVMISSLPTSSGDPSLPYLFMASSIAICAMILPGISGSFVLLMLGLYDAVTAAIDERIYATVIVFGLGAMVGLVLFSTFLSWLLDYHRTTVVAVLLGLMVGSLRVLWPWPAGEEGLENAGLGLPETGEVTGAVVGALVAGAAVIVVARLATRTSAVDAR